MSCGMASRFLFLKSSSNSGLWYLLNALWKMLVMSLTVVFVVFLVRLIDVWFFNTPVVSFFQFLNSSQQLYWLCPMLVIDFSTSFINFKMACFSFIDTALGFMLVYLVIIYPEMICFCKATLWQCPWLKAVYKYNRIELNSNGQASWIKFNEILNFFCRDLFLQTMFLCDSMLQLNKLQLSDQTLGP